MALLAGKKIVVIGGTTGIGLSAVKSFVTEGGQGGCSGYRGRKP